MELKLMTDVKDACIELITALPKLNDNDRKSMRSILLQLKGDLTSSFVMTSEYLRGVSRCAREGDLLDLLENSRGRLLDSFNEFKICAALYHLRDRFDQWFSTASYAVNASNMKAVDQLIKGIADGERFILVSLDDIVGQLPDFADDLRGAQDEDQKRDVNAALTKFVDESLSLLRKEERKIKSSISAAVALM